MGTQTGEVAWIDTGSLQVVERDIVPQPAVTAATFPGQNYVTAGQAYQLANGKVFVFSNWGGGFLGNFEAANPVEWDPVAGTSVTRPDSQGGGVVSISADHTKMLVAGAGLASYDMATDTFTTLPAQGGESATLSPTGTQFAVFKNATLNFYNPQMRQIGSTTLTGCCYVGAQTAVYSPDGSRVYVEYLPQNGAPVLQTIDTATYQVLGTAPTYWSETACFGGVTVAMPMAADATGLVFGLADHGVSITDATDYRSFANAEALQDFLIATPNSTPLSQEMYTEFTTSAFSTLPDVFFGNQTGLNPYFFNGAGQLSATAPASNVVGPVNVKAIQANGVADYMPQAFTYGALPIQYGWLAAPPSGGVSTHVFGYGERDSASRNERCVNQYENAISRRIELSVSVGGFGVHDTQRVTWSTGHHRDHSKWNGQVPEVFPLFGNRDGLSVERLLGLHAVRCDAQSSVFERQRPH